MKRTPPERFIAALPALIALADRTPTPEELAQARATCEAPRAAPQQQLPLAPAAVPLKATS